MALTASLLLFGCGSGDSGSISEEQAAPEAADIDDGAATGEAGGGDASDAQIDTGDRAVIYEAALEVEDPDPDGVAEAAWDLAESYGGFVTADERDRASGALSEYRYGYAHLVLRVPSEHFTDAMEDLTALAERERHRSVTTEDVTEATVDLASHIATKSASIERVRTLLAEATSIDAILELESELAQREGDLASLQSQLEDLEDRVALSTIEFTVAAPYVPAETSEDTGPANFWDGLVVGFSGAVSLLVGLSIAIGVILPFLPIAALVAAAVIVPIRLARKRREARDVPAVPASAPPVQKT
ncbi:MAG TPA: DUF4349 domain-containing protein [Glycomyces sp.]|nr:DUF4349 domain-containing protein [Glycomyces sp.]